MSVTLKMTRRQYMNHRFFLGIVGALATGFHFGPLVGIAYFCVLPFLSVVTVRQGLPFKE